MELAIMALIAFVCTMVVRRKEAFVIRWKPTRHTWVAVVTGLLVFLLSSALLLFKEGSQVVHFINYVVMWARGREGVRHCVLLFTFPTYVRFLNSSWGGALAGTTSGCKIR